MRLDTIADVRDQAERAARSWRCLNGKPVIGFEVMRAWGASALGVAKDARKAVEQLAKDYPQVKFTETTSTVGYIQTSYDARWRCCSRARSSRSSWSGCSCATGARRWSRRIALPLSVIPTFWAICALGFTLNMLTLLALSLVVGMLVDDAIVEVENIVRHLRMGKTPLQAATDAAIEIGLAVVATTLTLCAVFVPVAFMSGIPGQFFKPFGFTATIAVLFSLLVARMLTPMMAAYMLKPHEERREAQAAGS